MQITPMTPFLAAAMVQAALPTAQVNRADPK
jgi:hypothetical protein